MFRLQTFTIVRGAYCAPPAVVHVPAREPDEAIDLCSMLDPSDCSESDPEPQRDRFRDLVGAGTVLTVEA